MTIKFLYWNGFDEGYHDNLAGNYGVNLKKCCTVDYPKGYKDGWDFADQHVIGSQYLDCDCFDDDDAWNDDMKEQSKYQGQQPSYTDGYNDGYSDAKDGMKNAIEDDDQAYFRGVVDTLSGFIDYIKANKLNE